MAARPCVTMVGARNASPAAIKLSREFALELAQNGFVVVSGLARGIDGSVHEGAFPATIGVIASGIDIAYPPQHTNLQERIANEGLLLAEQPPGSESAEISSLLTTAPVAVDELICQSGASAAAVQMALLEIEIAGKLVRHAGARVSIRG